MQITHHSHLLRFEAEIADSPNAVSDTGSEVSINSQNRAGVLDDNSSPRSVPQRLCSKVVWKRVRIPLPHPTCVHFYNQTFFFIVFMYSDVFSSNEYELLSETVHSCFPAKFCPYQNFGSVLGSHPNSLGLSTLNSNFFDFYLSFLIMPFGKYSFFSGFCWYKGCNIF